MMIHSVGYLGPFDPNFGDLDSDYLEYKKYDGTKGQIDKPPADLDGIFFGYLERPGRTFVAVRARYHDVCINLKTPVPLIQTKHADGNGFGPKPSKLGDASAGRLLRDMGA